MLYVATRFTGFDGAGMTAQKRTARESGGTVRAALSAPRPKSFGPTSPFLGQEGADTAAETIRHKPFTFDKRPKPLARVRETGGGG
jgi:hypothetical protein